MSEQRIGFSKKKKQSELGSRKRHDETIQRELTRLSHSHDVRNVVPYRRVSGPYSAGIGRSEPRKYILLLC
jgi:hypothetical protein